MKFFNSLFFVAILIGLYGCTALEPPPLVPGADKMIALRECPPNKYNPSLDNCERKGMNVTNPDDAGVAELKSNLENGKCKLTEAKNQGYIAKTSAMDMAAKFDDFMLFHKNASKNFVKKAGGTHGLMKAQSGGIFTTVYTCK
jgi:hypothetical protein